MLERSLTPCTVRVLLGRVLGRHFTLSSCAEAYPVLQDISKSLIIHSPNNIEWRYDSTIDEETGEELIKCRGSTALSPDRDDF